MGLLTSPPPYLGDLAEDAAVAFAWGSVDGSGASVTRATNGTIKVRRQDNGADVTGGSVTDTEDTPDVGLHECIIDTSDTADFTVGNDYVVWLDGAVIAGQTVNAVLATFSIENRGGTPALVWDEILTGASHNIPASAGRIVRTAQEFYYEDGAIWIDTVNGTAGTTIQENGTMQMPVDSIADANTLSASLGIQRFRLCSGSSITFTASQNNQVFVGDNWTLALGGQDISGSVFVGANVSGLVAGTGTNQSFRFCQLDAVSHLANTHLIECHLGDTQTVFEAGNFFVFNCRSAVAGISAPSWDFGSALNASNLNFRAYSGGIHILNMGVGTGSYNMSLEGHGQFIINANCAGGLIAYRGHWVPTDNSGGAVTLSGAASVPGAEMDLVDAPNATAITAFFTALYTKALDGDIDFGTGLKQILAGVTNKFVASGTNPKVLEFYNDAGDTIIFTLSVPLAGTGRTKS